MPTDLPLFIVINEVLKHTPPQVWVVLSIITVLGIKQMRDHIVTARRLAIAPVALGAFSLWGALSAFGMRADVLAAWALGMALAVVANQWVAWPRTARYEGAGRYLLQGSVWPLVAMLSVFGVRYVSTVTLVLHPDWAHGAVFSLAMPLVYGALSGMFLARALRVLRSPQASGTLSLA